MLDDLLAWFGPARLAWGSDWPVLNLAAPPAFWLEVTSRLLADLAGPDRDAVLGNTAAHFYGLGVDRPAAPPILLQEDLT